MKLVLTMKGAAVFSITYSLRRLCLFPDPFTPNLQTTMLHRADAGGVLEADLETFTTEKPMLLLGFSSFLPQRLGEKRRLRKPELIARHISSCSTQGGEPGLGTTPKSAMLRHSHVLWECQFGRSEIPIKQPTSTSALGKAHHLPCLKTKTAFPRCLLRL